MGELVAKDCWFVNFIFSKNPIHFDTLSKLVLSGSNFISFEFLKLFLDTILLSFLSAGIAVSFPPTFILILNNQIGIKILRLISFIFRLIPPSIIILILLIFNNPSISLAALTLGLHNAAITSKLLLTNLSKQDNEQYLALKALGVRKRSRWLYGLFIKQAKSYLAYCAYRSDIIIRETAILGVIGSVGLGWQLQESLSSFAWEEVIIILIAYSSIAIVGELINGKIKSKLTWYLSKKII